MKRIVVMFSLFFSGMFCACNQSAPTQPTFSGSMTLHGYGDVLDSSYYKVWSDSSWEAFYQDTTINGKTYVTILDAYGNEYFYDSLGYSGFELPQLYGDSTIIFDAPLPSLPDTLVGNKTYALQTTFSFQGTSYSLINDETLVDTSAITVLFGTFTNCPGIQSDQVIASGNMGIAGNDIVYWLAKGPSEIEQDFLDFGYSIFMVYGVVNDKGWGVSFPKGSLGGIHPHTGTVLNPKLSAKSSSQSTLDIHSIAPMILKGIIPKLRFNKF